MSKKEKTNLRDRHYSMRHRHEFPSDLYNLDVDSVEANAEGKPVAIIEVKHPNIYDEKGKICWKDLNFQVKVLNNIADALGIPCMLVIPFYWNNAKNDWLGEEDGTGYVKQFSERKTGEVSYDDPTGDEAEYVSDGSIDKARYNIYFLNGIAQQRYGGKAKFDLTELQYIQLLMNLRNNIKA